MNATVNATGAASRSREADGMAVASFVLGLIGLLLFNVVLGPLALALGALALVRGTARRGRALLGLALGAADLVVLAVTIAHSHGVLWQIG
ncbi:DUF4190 domain-containing protein [Streptomyces tateyamensis]|uniref:DUF4190 domain-containing protein n=1 Tax=Streptomyces tateyamensis TaxID=565073 RepID=A0A2V4MSZ5_9ACTN|nr:DUF4190 domain-containing protein [Streptomyces tateyamensis]PYC66356.1 DUF4190 domain-containing protein [Streptomyces tateyamensis]